MDSKVNPFNAVNLGPGRDLVAPYVKAVREAGLKVGLYYSPASGRIRTIPERISATGPAKRTGKAKLTADVSLNITGRN